MLGLFFPQLGFASNEAVLVVRWLDEARAGRGVVKIDRVQLRLRDRLTATLRPTASDAPQFGGVDVHRWFTVALANVERFVDLSGRAWPSFEAGFDTNIFGLFRAKDATPREDSRLLLLTRHADQCVWEASREPPNEARVAFGARRDLTTSTITRSSAASSTAVDAFAAIRWCLRPKGKRCRVPGAGFQSVACRSWRHRLTSRPRSGWWDDAELLQETKRIPDVPALRDSSSCDP